MPIDLRRERLLPAKLLAHYAPLSSRSAKPPHASTIVRWCLKGRKRRDGTQVLLESIRTKGGVLSSRAALNRFLAALDDDDGTQGESSGTESRFTSTAVRRKELEKVQAELDAAGI